MVLIIFLLSINIIAFFLYGIDKKKAIDGRFRISEATLITLAVVGVAFCYEKYTNRSLHLEALLYKVERNVFWYHILIRSEQQVLRVVVNGYRTTIN